MHVVAALAAVHEVDLAVADAEAVAAVPAAQLVAVRVADELHVEARQRPQAVVTVAAVLVVAAAVGEDHVAAQRRRSACRRPCRPR